MDEIIMITNTTLEYISGAAMASEQLAHHSVRLPTSPAACTIGVLVGTTVGIGATLLLLFIILTTFYDT